MLSEYNRQYRFRGTEISREAFVDVARHDTDTKRVHRRPGYDEHDTRDGTTNPLLFSTQSETGLPRDSHG